MSYILDALKKADEARHRTRNPILDRVRAPGDGPRRRWPWIAAAAVVLAVNGAVLVHLLRPSVVERVRDSAPPQPPSTRSPSPPARADAATPPPVQAPRARADAAKLPAQTPPARVEAVKPPAQASPARVEAVKPPAQASPARVDAAKPPAQAPAARVDAATAAQTPPSPRPEERRAEATAPARVQAAPVPPPPAATPGVPRIGTAPTGAPAQREVPPELSSPARPASSAPGSAGGDVLSKLRLTVHVYADSPGDRLVFIDGRKYVPGDQIDGKALLEEITQDGAVVSFEGQRRLLRP